jgi:NADH:ubiquinone oxidoreductase subunit
MPNTRFYYPASQVFKTFFDSIKERGVYQTLKRVHLYNTIKPGTYVGSDSFGNKYYEDKQGYMDLRSRYMELATTNGKYKINATKLDPEWHAWMCKITHDIPSEVDYPQRVYGLKQMPVSLSNMATEAKFTPSSYYIRGADVKGVVYKSKRYNSWTPPNKPVLKEAQQ